MKQILPIFKREFFGYFRTPLAYAIILFYLLLSFILTFYLTRFYDTGIASLEAFFSMQIWVYLFFVSAVGMRLWAEEKHSGTIELLFTLPVRIHEAVFAKYLAGWAIVLTGLALTFPLVLTLAYLGDPDWGPVLTGYVGCALLSGSMMAVCSFTSSLTQNQIISFLLSLIINFLLLAVGFSLFTSSLLFLPASWIDLINNFSYTTHFDPFMRGLIAFKDLVFFLSVTLFSLLLTVVVLER